MEDFDYYKDKLNIDIDVLHKECSIQAKIYQEVGDRVAELRYEVKSAKINLELQQANLDLDIRLDCKKYGLEKVTENTIRSLIDIDEEINFLKEEFLKLEKEYERWNNLLTALDHRRSMLKSEVDLYQANYWGDVSIKEDIKLSRKQIEKAIEEESN